MFAKDLERVEAFYRAHGFYDAHARAGRVEYVSPKHVRVTNVVEEGPPTLVRDVSINGLQDLPIAVRHAAEYASVKKLSKGQRFEDDAFDETEKYIERTLTDQGYAYAKVTREAKIDLEGRYALVFYDVKPGPPAKFGDVKIDGLAGLPEKPVRRALDISPGETYSTSKIDAAKQAILDLGVFGNVTITPISTAPRPRRPSSRSSCTSSARGFIKSRSAAASSSIRIRTDVHLITAWDNHNFLGGLRSFHVELRPGVVLYPLRLQTPLDAPTNLLPEEKARVELRQPGFIEARTNGLLRGEIDTYPVLLTPQSSGPGVPVLGYFEAKAGAGLERVFGRIYASLTYNLQHDQPFAYLGPLDPTLGPINVIYLELAVHLDLRDDKLHPHSGAYFLNNFQFAGLGGNARDLREQPDLRVYLPLARRLTLALRGTLGFLDPLNYGATLQNPALEAANGPEWVQDSQLVYLRGFFSGGPSSNRGYPLYGVGPHGAVPFFNPTIAASQVANSCATNFDPSRCAVPLGGFSLWELSAEARVHVSGPFETAIFCDASDLEPGQFEFYFDRADRYHLSCGVGARYDTPVGPIRLDIGLRIPGLNPDFNNPAVVATNGDPGTIFGIPAAVSLGIGESF